MLIPCQKSVIPYRYLQCRLVSSSTRIITKENIVATAYKPEFVERNKYQKWERNAVFQAETPTTKPSFSMILPPPNVTGKLHLGHALACTVQDVIVRRKRMQGYNVLWLPGTDHAGIATQGVVEKYLKSTQNIDRHNISREKFNEEVWKWKEKHGDVICTQLRQLGCSLDWPRQVFTMDPGHSKAVTHAFVTLFKRGLIYRKKALVNWCNLLRSTVSDMEVDNVEIESPTDIDVPGYKSPVRFGVIYDFAYRVLDSDEEIVVSTTMPETMFGDTAIAVHPEDTRYSHLRGKRVIHPFIPSKFIPIIFDKFVDMNFGTGAVKITPAHSKVDYHVGKNHNLHMIQVIDEEGKMINADRFTAQKRYDCRNNVVESLNDLGLLKNISPHKMTLPKCSRSGGIIDYIPKEQWFLYCHKLNEKAAEIVERGKLTIVPPKYVKNWLDWTKSDRDWCISRQLWWGHQVPAYKCYSDQNVVWVAAENEHEAKQEASTFLRTLPSGINAERDTDVLDTWFSSGIYPFAALGWPDKMTKQEYQSFYPIDLMATGHDILGFWVHRMVILGLELTGQLPFSKVLLHGVICDNKGAKMSKSKGNVIDPIDVINGISLKGLALKSEEMYKQGILNSTELKKAKSYHKANFSNTNGIPTCGADALRFTLLSQDVKSHFVNFDVDLCHTNKLFCNKIWQSIRYTNMAFDKLGHLGEVSKADLNYFDKWILSRLAHTVGVVNDAMDKYDFHIATRSLKHHIYNEFCDFYVEATKPGFLGEDSRISYAHAHTLSAVLNTSLRCLAPFMVYLADEVIHRIPGFQKNIICNYYDDRHKHLTYPEYKDFEEYRDTEIDNRAQKLLNTVNLVRQLKGFYNISNKARPMVCIESKEDGLLKDLEDNHVVFLNLTRAGVLSFDRPDASKKLVSGKLNNDTKVSVELIIQDANFDIETTKKKLEMKIRKLEQSLAKIEAKQRSQDYLISVPQWTQILEQEQLSNKKEQLRQLKIMYNA